MTDPTPAPRLRYKEMFAEADRELMAISRAIGSVEFMDPPDGGDVSMAEQVRRMRKALDDARLRVEELETPAAAPRSAPAPTREEHQRLRRIVEDPAFSVIAINLVEPLLADRDALASRAETAEAALQKLGDSWSQLERERARLAAENAELRARQDGLLEGIYEHVPESLHRLIFAHTGRRSSSPATPTEKP